MRPKFSKRESSFLAMSRGHRTASFELLHGDAAWPTVLCSYHMEIVDQLLLLALPKEKLWCFVESDYRDTKNAKDQNEDTIREPHIAPPLMVGQQVEKSSIARAYHIVVTVAGESRDSTIPSAFAEERPGERRTDDRSKTPPASQKGQEPLFVARQIFKEDGRVQYQVPSSAER